MKRKTADYQCPSAPGSTLESESQGSAHETRIARPVSKVRWGQKEPEQDCGVLAHKSETHFERASTLPQSYTPKENASHERFWSQGIVVRRCHGDSRRTRRTQD